MKKILAISLVVLTVFAVLTPGFGAQAAKNKFNNNTMDDGTVIQNSSSNKTTSININSSATIISSQTTIANTGGNTIIAGGDIKGATIITGDATVYSSTVMSVNNTSVKLNGSGSGGSSNGNEANNNQADDATITQNSKVSETTIINNNQDATIIMNDTTVANTGNNAIICEEDCENVAIITGNATVGQETILDVNSTDVVINESVSGSSSSVNESNDNNFDDAAVNQNIEEDNKEKIENDTTVFSVTNSETVADAGSNTLTAGEDLKNGYIFSGNSKIEKFYVGFFNNFRLRRNR